LWHAAVVIAIVVTVIIAIIIAQSVTAAEFATAHEDVGAWRAGTNVELAWADATAAITAIGAQEPAVKADRGARLQIAALRAGQNATHR
jgi:hypothetical protein